MSDPAVLTTARLELSMPTEVDIDAITSACRDPQIARWTTVPSPYSRAHAEDFVRDVATRWVDGTEATWAVRSTGSLAGMIGLHRIHDGDAELGYWIASGARGKGYAVEAGRAVLEYAFGSLSLHRVEWHAVVGNSPSARTAQALGFRYEGVRRGAVRTSPREDGWLAAILATDARDRQPWPVDTD